MRARVTFLDTYEGPGCGTKRDVEVEVPHLSRAPFVARAVTSEVADSRRWHVLAVAELREETA